MKRVGLSLAFCLLAFGSTAHAQRFVVGPSLVQEPVFTELTVEMQASPDALGQDFKFIADPDTAGGVGLNRGGPVCNYAAGERLMVDQAFNYRAQEIDSIGPVTLFCAVSKQHHASCWANGVAGPAFVITVSGFTAAPGSRCDTLPNW